MIGIYFGEQEGSTFWRQVLNDPKMRGIEDTCIACIDNLKGFADVIEDLFSKHKYSPSWYIRCATVLNT